MVYLLSALLLSHCSETSLQDKRSDATLEEAALLSTRFGESGLLLENCILKLYVCLYKLSLAVPIQKCLNTTKSEVPELFPPKNF